MENFHQMHSSLHGAGEAFKGAQFRRLMGKDIIYYLENLLPSNDAPQSSQSFFKAMKAFIRLKAKCFHKVISGSCYTAELANSKAACCSLDVRKIPVKMHIFVAHLYRALVETGRGLVADSEQAGEAAQYNFDVIWQRYTPRCVSSVKYVGIAILREMSQALNMVTDCCVLRFSNIQRSPQTG